MNKNRSPRFWTLIVAGLTSISHPDWQRGEGYVGMSYYRLANAEKDARAFLEVGAIVTLVEGRGLPA